MRFLLSIIFVLFASFAHASNLKDCDYDHILYGEASLKITGNNYTLDFEQGGNGFTYQGNKNDPLIAYVQKAIKDNKHEVNYIALMLNMNEPVCASQYIDFTEFYINSIVEKEKHYAVIAGYPETSHIRTFMIPKKSALGGKILFNKNFSYKDKIFTFTYTKYGILLDLF